MKTTTFIFTAYLVLLLSNSKVSGQNFHTINSSHINYYKANHSYWNYELEENIQAVKTDSVRALPSGDSVFYFNRIMRDTSHHSFEECILDTIAPSWMGSHAIIRPNGDNLFFNKEGDTIMVKTQAGIGDSWVFMRRNNLYYQANLDSLVLIKVSGNDDYVKVFSIHAYSNNGTPVQDWFNQKTFRLSKNHGFASLYTIHDFPADTNLFESNEYEPLTISSVYNFEVGDIFHFKSGSNMGGPPQYKVITILSKWMSAGNDTTNYSQKEIWYINSLVWDPDPHVVSTTRTDTVTVSYANPGSLLSAVLPHQKTHSSAWDIHYYSLLANSNNWNNRPTMTFDYSRPYMFDAGLNCYTAAFEPVYNYYSYTKGCGASYFFQEAQADFASYYTKLVYFMKGNETWGDPFIFDAVNEIPKEEVLVNVYPNPFRDQIEIHVKTIASGRISLYLYSITGELLLTIEDAVRQSGNFTYSPDVSGLAIGVYLLKFASGGNIRYLKLIRN